MRWLMVCESDADFQTASELCDRVLRERGPAWLSDALEAMRTWGAEEKGHIFFRVKELNDYCAQHRVKKLQGHFDGKPGAAMAQVARNALCVAEHFRKQGTDVDAVLLVGDMDQEGSERRLGYQQARDEGRRLYAFQIVLGCPEIMREAWVLNGFDAQHEAEHARLRALKQDLGFSPIEEAHRLDAQDEQAKKSPKRAVKHLTGGDRDRERRCWRDTPLDDLEKRGQGSGLAAYLKEVETILLPLLTR